MTQIQSRHWLDTDQKDQKSFNAVNDETPEQISRSPDPVWYSWQKRRKHLHPPFTFITSYHPSLSTIQITWVTQKLLVNLSWCAQVFRIFQEEIRFWFTHCQWVLDCNSVWWGSTNSYTLGVKWEYTLDGFQCIKMPDFYLHLGQNIHIFVGMYLQAKWKRSARKKIIRTS